MSRMATRFEAEAMNKPRSDSDVAKTEYRMRIVWFNVLNFAVMHLAALYGAYLAVTSAKLYTIIFAIFLYNITGIGVTAGAHRLWAHRSYKATWQLQLILMIFNTIAFQEPVIRWVRDHRLHHKYTDTDADPHNSTRGLFYAHIGWVLSKRHPDVIAKGKGIDIDDLKKNGILVFQQRHYFYLMPLLCFILPTIIPVHLWGETWVNALLVAGILRYVLTINATFLVNSVAHRIGDKPYDKSINPSESKIVSAVALGEGWHNFHHTFPWDYKAAELGNYEYNFTTAFIDFFARVGWAYDLKTVSPANVRDRVMRSGDGTHAVWGWDDKEQNREERDAAILINPKGDRSATNRDSCCN